MLRAGWVLLVGVGGVTLFKGASELIEILKHSSKGFFLVFFLQVHKTGRWGWWDQSLAVLCQSSVEPSPATQTACSPGHCRWLDQACALFGEFQSHQLVLLRTRLGPVDHKILTHRE